VRGCIVTFSDVSELHRANQALQRLATRDPLTGCLNRRAFLEAFEALCAGARRERGALSCVMVDIDHFKAVNDEHGHTVGDRVIQQVAQCLLQHARESDLVCRYGGEEFCMALPGLTLAGAMALAERLRACIAAECGAAVREVAGLRVTASLGVQGFSTQCASPALMIDQADQALYRAKRGGRNRVHGASAAEVDEAVLVSV
jgi:diguanylate cyclase (GGDEF)-like protein